MPCTGAVNSYGYLHHPLDLRLRDILLTPEGMVLDFQLSGRIDIHLKALD